MHQKFPVVTSQACFHEHYFHLREQKIASYSNRVYILLLSCGGLRPPRRLSLEKRKIIFFPFLSRLTLSSQSYLPFSSNKISHATEKCSIVKTISIITCWRSLPEPFVISCGGLRPPRRLSLEKRKIIFFPFLSRLTLSSQSYLPFSSNKISHATEKCSIVKTISIITCWRSLPEPFVIFPWSGLRLLKALVNVKKNHRENLDSVLSTAPNQTVI